MLYTYYPPNSNVQKIRVGCPAHNCGGRCLLIAHIEDGKIVRLDTDDRPDTIAAPQLRACARGRAYLRRQYHPDRLLYPLKRVGKRGEGKFVRISWDEALGEVSSQMVRIKSEYGNDALFVPYGTGSYNQLNGSHVARRLMNLFGGCLGIYNSYSWGATNIATPTVYGTLVTGNQRQDWLNSRYIIMWGWNPAEMRDGTNSDYFVKLARENGARVVCIDPRHSLSAAALADEWIPIRPGTDAAMMSAMAYVMLTENLHDADFVRTHCVGFDASQMPVEGAESYSDYLLGARDGIPKTPEWAEAITAVPAATIARIAREYATSKPAALVQGYGMQRRAYGEQVVRAGCVLAAISGNVGISGGWASGLGLQADDGGPHWTVFPLGENPVRASIPVFLWTEACLRAQALTSAEGVLGVPRLQNNIKLIYAVATNCLINQHADVNRSAEILRDESKVEFIVVQDNFLTPTGMFADIILPACTQFETWGVEDGWKYGDEVILQPKLVEPPGEVKIRLPHLRRPRRATGHRRSLHRRTRRKRLGGILFDMFSGQPVFLSCQLSMNLSKRISARIPTLSQIQKSPSPISAPTRRNIRSTPPAAKSKSSPNNCTTWAIPNEIPAVPKYIQEWESPFAHERAARADEANANRSTRLRRLLRAAPRSQDKYPLQAIGHHTLARVHSTHANNDWLQEAFPQRIFINPIDAAARDIHDGDLVRVWNERGELVIPARVTPRILPGVVDIPQGAWWKPDANGVDHGGCINVLTSHRWTPLAFGSTQQTIMVEVEKTRGRWTARPMLRSIGLSVHRRGSK